MVLLISGVALWWAAHLFKRVAPGPRAALGDKGKGLVAVLLVLSVVLMGVAANIIAKYIERYRWIAYVGLVVIVFVAGRMIWEGAHEVAVGLGDQGDAVADLHTSLGSGGQQPAGQALRLLAAQLRRQVGKSLLI